MIQSLWLAGWLAEFVVVAGSLIVYGFVWGEPPWQGNQWAMVFEDGFRVNFVIVFVIVLLSFCVT